MHSTAKLHGSDRFAPCYARLRAFIARRVRSRHDAEDLTHETYARALAWEERAALTHPERALFRIARNLLIDRIRRENIVAIEAVADMETLGITVDEPGPDRTAIARQELRRLQAALNRLPDKWRETVVMRKIEGLSRPQIAERLGVAEPTVSQYLAQGMTALADFFSNDPTDTGGAP